MFVAGISGTAPCEAPLRWRRPLLFECIRETVWTGGQQLVPLRQLDLMSVTIASLECRGIAELATGTREQRSWVDLTAVLQCDDC